MPEIQSLIESINLDLKISEDNKSIIAGRDQIVQLLQILRDDYKFIMLLDITSADYNDYFEVIYHVSGLDANFLRVKVRLEKGDENIPSITSLWIAAEVMECEVFDLMGIVFTGRDNLRRILNKDDFEGHPLRKDFELDFVNRF